MSMKPIMELVGDDIHLPVRAGAVADVGVGADKVLVVVMRLHGGSVVNACEGSFVGGCGG